MGVKELCYKIEEIPDLSLNKYASLEGNGVNGVLEKHLAFLVNGIGKEFFLEVLFIYTIIMMVKRRTEHMLLV